MEQKTQDFFAVYSNSDLTEGKGRIELVYITKLEATARRLAKGRGVMGSDAIVDTIKLPTINGIPYQPAQVVNPTIEDETNEVALYAARALKYKKAKLLEKLKEDGYSQEDIELLKS